MSARDYQDFIAASREVFGLDYEDAVGLYQEMRGILGYALDADDLEEYADMASDLVEPAHLIYEEDFDAVEFEDRYGEEIEAGAMEIPAGRIMEEPERELPDDEWLDVGDELEITAYYSET